ncbi:hypothetical protein U9M48_038426 [Paspalum notatum var. saurae]|uniref:Uncharacterized protein n=1 Tax=Paspalum notatum var. saurae TaxID=547442 RepID=A0AAQ3XB23_PASNO
MRGGWHEAYSFAYHPGAAQFKVVHVPCYFDRSGGFSELQVFKFVYAHRMRLVAGRSQSGEEVRSVRSITEQGQQLVDGLNGSSIRGVFAYAKTEEPLSVCLQVKKKRFITEVGVSL